MEGKLNPVLVNSLLALLTGLLLLWFFHANPPIARALSDRVCSLLSVAERPAEDLRGVVREASNRMLERQTLQERSRELEAENIRLRMALAKAAVPLPPESADGGLIDARVTLRYPESWWSEIRVDKGSRDGVPAGAPAISDGCMVGRVTRVGEDYAWIELVTASTFMLAAVIDDTWDLGVVNGDGDGGIWLLYAPADKKFERGMTISTALVGDYLPPGIPVGRLLDAGEESGGDAPQRVASGAHLTQLYGVQILRYGWDGTAGPAK